VNLRYLDLVFINPAVDHIVHQSPVSSPYTTPDFLEAAPTMELVIRLSPRAINPKSPADNPPWIVDMWWKEHHKTFDLPQSLESFSGPEAAETKWYLEDYAPVDPFDRTRAEAAAFRLRENATAIAMKILLTFYTNAQNRLNLSLQVEFGTRTNRAPDFLWEALQDTGLWQGPESLIQSVRVIRSYVGGDGSGVGQQKKARKEIETLAELSILLVVARPGRREDINYRLISRPLVEALERIQGKGRCVTLDFVRPATWEMFVEVLKERHRKGKRYDIVHFDMHGEVNGDR
jgi:hypothetical protein